jgi:hypothetical protein
MMFEDFAQGVVEFVWAHETWDVPVVVRLDFGQPPRSRS